MPARADRKILAGVSRIASNGKKRGARDPDSQPSGRPHDLLRGHHLFQKNVLRSIVMKLPAGNVVSDQHVVGPLKQALPSARKPQRFKVLPCGNPGRASLDSRGRRLVLKREIRFFCRATYESRDRATAWFACSISRAAIL